MTPVTDGASGVGTLSGSSRFARHQLVLWRRAWYGSAFSTFLSPVLYLAGLGLGLGALVEDGGAAAALGGISYAAFAGTGLLAASAMQTAAGEMSWSVMGAITYTRTWVAAAATPLQPAHLLGGKVAVLVLRLTVSGIVFALALAVLDLVPLGGALAAVGPAVLTGISVGMSMLALSVHAKETTIAYVFRFAITPLFILSGTFFPISQLPAMAQPLAAASPLWHGVELVRAAAFGMPPAWPAAVHMAVLVVTAVAGWALAVRLLARRLHP